jgi:hypothetical protein
MVFAGFDLTDTALLDIATTPSNSMEQLETYDPPARRYCAFGPYVVYYPRLTYPRLFFCYILAGLIWGVVYSIFVYGGVQFKKVTTKNPL